MGRREQSEPLRRDGAVTIQQQQLTDYVFIGMNPGV